ncbi:heavy metal-responsive transcriptional regulator (plasmid) [Deinococcus aetherius]|uniref:Heavy metal-responsive transcriptional regulator n=1 Tax=Deinococcus aetherius TaxID=200252 RepID=A0ABM8AJL9_9DEIO|nr:MerR family transcriptional regulator [Deinococcus aetherius]BDP43998.1 heavy metal-responsive transcriptional regulator [Deinococcus aetherius]
MRYESGGASIGRLAQITGETVKTLRYWTDLGLLPCERRDTGYRVYGPDATSCVRFIRSAQQVGFSLQEIARVLGAQAQGTKPCSEVQQALAAHLVAVRVQLAQLQALEGVLVERLTYAQAHPDPVCDSPGCVYLNPQG